MAETMLHGDTDFLSSSYVLLTSERILEGFGIIVSDEDLHAAIHNHDHIYHLLLKIPFKNVINGIILQQVMDYQVYVQKLFVDYLLSGSANVNKDDAPTESQEKMEEIRVRMQNLCTSFEQLQQVHNSSISKSQEQLIEWSKKYKTNFETGFEAIKEINASFENTVTNINQQLRNMRTQFKAIIVETKAAIQLMTDYKFNEEKDVLNMSSLIFDDAIE